MVVTSVFASVCSDCSVSIVTRVFPVMAVTPVFPVMAVTPVFTVIAV